nr:SMI1/KNR4 family protein [Spelaeicoccus albus]
MNPPASRETLDEWRHQVGDDFPDCLVELYDAADGEASRPFSYVFSDAFVFVPASRLLGVNVSNERAARLWEMSDDIDSKADALKPNPGYSKSWIPFSTRGSDTLAVDMDPSAQGQAGQIVKVTHPAGIVQEVVAPSLSALLQQQIDMLRRYEFHVVDHDGNWLASPHELAEYFRDAATAGVDAEIYVQPEAGADASAFQRRTK